MTLTGVAHPERILRLGMLGEKRYFTEFPDLYEIVMLNANLAEGFSAGVAAFVATLGKPFIIDPMTHAFGHEPREAVMKYTDGKWEVKASVRALADRYGPLIRDKVGREAIVPDDLSPRAMAGLCEQVISFQADRLREALGPEERKYMPEDMADRLTVPEALICPYFFMPAATWAEWLPKNIELCEHCVTAEDLASPVLAMLCLDGDMLFDPDAMARVTRDYQDLSVPGYCVWISDSPEWELSPTEAEAMARLFRQLSQDGERLVYKIYGGYFAGLLSLFGASGFSFGPGYGEYRSVVPVGGGLPQPKYYLPPVHRRLDAAMVQALLPDTAPGFYQTICDCPKCEALIGENVANFVAYMETGEGIDKNDRAYSYATQATRERSVWHYLYARDSEVKRIGSSPVARLQHLLQTAFQRYRSVLGDAGASHLRTWAQVLEQLEEPETE